MLQWSKLCSSHIRRLPSTLKHINESTNLRLGIIGRNPSRVNTTKTSIKQPHLLNSHIIRNMDLLNPYLLATLTIASTLLYLLLQPHPTTNLARWLQKKNYQYEVTFSLYMLTPTEKFVFSMRILHQYMEERLADNSVL